MPASGEFTPLEMDRYITGLVRQRNPLRDASVPYDQAQVYKVGRYDSIWDGLNTEITADLSIGRRPGNVPYNTQDFPPIFRFYEHHIIVDGTPSIRVMVDTAAVVYDGTGPSTKNAIWTKTAPGKTFFQSVGNTLYFTNGTDRKKWFVPVKAWHPTTTYNAGDTIMDPNGNIQVAFGAIGIQIIESAVVNAHPPGLPPTGSAVHLFLNPSTSPFINGQEVTFSGLNQVPIINGQTLPIVVIGSFISVSIPLIPVTGGVENGLAYTTGDSDATGVSGATQPAWPTTIGTLTTDGTVRWICKGSSVTDWGTDGPTIAPLVSQSQRATTLKSWQPNTFYTALPFLLPPTGTGVSVQQIVTAGISAAATPTYSLTPGTNTANGAAAYTCIHYIPAFSAAGDGNWSASAVVNVGDIIAVFLPAGGYFMQAVQPGTTGATQPIWSDAFGNLQADNTVVWQNFGLAPTATPLSTNLAIEGEILDESGHIETVTANTSGQAFGTSGATEPTWPMSVGTVTPDSTLNWLDSAAFSQAFTNTVIYYYSFRSSITSTESNLSPASTPIMRIANAQVLVQGFGSPDPQDDTIRIYRTEQGQPIPEFLADYPMPPGGPNGVWIFADMSMDADLNVLIQGALNLQNSRPPLGLTALTYHLSRIWGIVKNLVYNSTGPDETPTNGNGNEAWSPGNVSAYPNIAIRLEPVTIDNGGIFVFTVSDIWAIRGDGTASNNFAPSRYARGIGLLNYDALDIIGATIHMQTTAKKQISLDPSAGYIETGQVIGDQFKRVTVGGFDAPLFTPATTFVTWHESESGDTGLIVADGAVGWFRYSPTTSPETGFVWNNFAAIEGGTSAVQSVETTPGVKQLLMGPSGTGKILARDTTIHADNSVPYSDTYVDFGSMQLCRPYELAEIGGVVLDSKKIGTPPTCGILFGEIKETDNVPFDMLERTGNDPPLLPTSETLFSERFDTLQNGECILCRHMQLRIQWSVEDAASELLTHTLYVKVSSERP